MSGIIKASVVQDGASATANLTLDASGNVAVGANQTIAGTLAVTGTTTLTGGVTQTGSSTAASFIPSGSSVPTNGVFLPSANTVAIATNSTNQVSISSTGIVTGTAGNLMLVQGTSQASTSGTSIPFTGIPSWAKRINVILSGVSTAGTSPIIVRLGTSSGIDSTGYSGACGNRATETFFTTSFIFGISITAADTFSGQMFVSNVTGNTWSETSILGGSSGNAPQMGAGTKTLSGVLDRVSITTVNGTDTFDAGTINIQYE